jgi:DNA-binding response OmpR family regulator
MKLLVIEDEPSLMKSIIEYFTQEDYLCETAASYQEGIEKSEDFQYDCIILDINLPGGSGLKILEYLRSQQKTDGVIIISARDSLDDKIAGLNLGADDYLSKPFHLSELNARVKALLRRKYTQGTDILEIGNLRLNLLSRSVSCSGQPILLTKNEYDLLVFLMNNKNRVVGRQAIAEHIYGGQAENLPSLDFVYSQIKNLKKKLKDKGCGEMIQTVYGLGYRLSL